jgi:hypothetical protein
MLPSTFVPSAVKANLTLKVGKASGVYLINFTIRDVKCVETQVLI